MSPPQRNAPPSPKKWRAQTFQVLPDRRFLKQDDVRLVSGHLGSGPSVGDVAVERHHADGSPLLASFLPPSPGRVSEADDRSDFLNKQGRKSDPQRQHGQAPDVSASGQIRIGPVPARAAANTKPAPASRGQANPAAASSTRQRPCKIRPKPPTPPSIGPAFFSGYRVTFRPFIRTPQPCQFGWVLPLTTRPPDPATSTSNVGSCACTHRNRSFEPACVPARTLPTSPDE